MSSKQVRTARKYYECPDTSYAHDRLIKPGDKYVRVTVFPHDDVFVGNKPWQYAQCLDCGLAGLINESVADLGIRS